MCRLCLFAVLTALGIIAHRTAAAQVVRGTVVLTDGAPAVGVIVVATGGNGRTLGRALTNERGDFSLGRMAPGSVGLRLLRIGYRPTTLPAVEIGQDSVVRLRLVFAAEPVILSSVHVNERETCDVGADSGLVVAQLWEDARKAMLSTQLGADSTPLMAEWAIYDRVLDSTARLVRTQHVRTERNLTTHAFRGESAERLAKNGYVVSEGDTVTFLAPDAEALLSEAFAASHCFRLEQTGSDSSRRIGVHFEPAATRRTTSDIQGTLWLDRPSRELRKLEFRYTNLPEIAEAMGAGGHVEFLRLDDGDWIVSRWQLRMPQIAAQQAPLFAGRLTVSGAHLAVRGVEETGGTVVRLSRRNTVLYEVLGPQITVQLLQRDTLVRAAQALLTLDGTDYVGHATASGIIELLPVIAGRYHARIRTPLMDSLEMAPVELDMEPRMDASTDTVWLPVARTVLELRVRDIAGAPLPGTTLELRGSSGSERRTVVTDVAGRAVMRDVTPDSATLHARHIGYNAGTLALSIKPGRSTVTIALEAAAAPALDTVRVLADRALPLRLLDFERRRLNHEASASITSDDIHRRNPAQSWQMLTGVPSIRVVDNDTIVAARSTRTTIANSSNEYCWMLVAVDGVVLNRTPGHTAFDLRQLPPVDEIYGIEVFAGAASIPLAYGGEGDGKWCGLIAVWTR
jgi:carboxypeptidase family protein